MRRLEGARRRQADRLLSIVAAALVGSSCATAGNRPRAEPTFARSPDAALRALPFSEAVRVGELLYLSGQIGTRPGTLELVPGGIMNETRQTLENVRGILVRNSSSLERVVKCTVFLADMAEWQAMNEVYVEFFPNHPPARSALGTSGLALGARVEIECIAVVARDGE